MCQWTRRRQRFYDQREARNSVEGADWADQEFIHGCDARTQNVLKSEKWKSEKWKSKKWKSEKWKSEKLFSDLLDGTDGTDGTVEQ